MPSVMGGKTALAKYIGSISAKYIDTEASDSKKSNIKMRSSI